MILKGRMEVKWCDDLGGGGEADTLYGAFLMATNGKVQ
jgi:hypothetical protein